MDAFACSFLNKVFEMPDVSFNGRLEGQNGQFESVNEKLTEDEDLLMEQILENLNATPIGRVLKKISSLPEIRQDKVLDVRRQLTNGKYELNERLDTVLEKVLDDLDT